MEKFKYWNNKIVDKITNKKLYEKTVLWYIFYIKMNSQKKEKVHYHLPGLFEFYELYKKFLPLLKNHKEYFYDWCDIGSVYGAPADCVWGGGRVGFGENNPAEVFALMKEFEISPRLTFSNSLLREEHLSDKKCNDLCKKLESSCDSGGIIVHSDLLLAYLKNKYPEFYYVSSTTKVITEFELFKKELNRDDFKFVVPDFRLNKSLEAFNELQQNQKDKVEFLCNECCWFGCKDRKKCYENVSRKSLGEDCLDHKCNAPDGNKGYVFSKAMENPGFISVEDITDIYLPMGFTNFKIEGRSLGSAVVFEMLLYYMIKPQYRLQVREHIYLDSMLDLF